MAATNVGKSWRFSLTNEITIEFTFFKVSEFQVIATWTPSILLYTKYI